MKVCRLRIKENLIIEISCALVVCIRVLFLRGDILKIFHSINLKNGRKQCILMNIIEI